MLSAAGPGVRGPRTGMGTGPCAVRLGTPLASPWLSLGFDTGVFVWLPPGVGMETHRGSGSLPRANISVTHSPGSMATAMWGVALPGGQL